MIEIGLITGTIIVPFSAVLLNLMIRNMSGSPSTGGADSALFLITLDAAALLAHNEFKALASSELVRAEFIQIFVGLLFISLIVWVFNLWFFEKRINRSFNFISGKYNNYPLCYTVLSWGIVVSLIICHFLIFTY